MPGKKNDLEEQLADLEEIVNNLENDNVLLDEALEQLQVGVRISRGSEKKLAATEETVVRLIDEDDTERGLDPQNATAPEG